MLSFIDFYNVLHTEITNDVFLRFTRMVCL